MLGLVLPCLWWLFWLAPTPAQARESAVDIQLFRPSISGTGYLSAESANTNLHLGISAGLSLNYVHKPLEILILNADGSKQNVGAVVKNRIDITATAALGLFNYGEIGISFPAVWQGGLDQAGLDAAQVNVGTTDLPAITQGDLRIIAKGKAYALPDNLFTVGALLSVAVPTGSQSPYVGEKGPVYEPTLLLSSHLWRFRLSANLGYRVREAVQLQTLTIDDEIFFRFATAFNIFDTRNTGLELMGELNGQTQTDSIFSFGTSGARRELQSAGSPVEAIGGARLKIFRDYYLTGAFGFGITPGYGAPTPRIFLGFMWYRGKNALPDEDDDGVPDVEDECPKRPEDWDQFEDIDGCPDPDNDADKILDEDDNCPDEAEDYDAFEDDDGCPEPDNDEDGVLDADDQCSTEPEDRDGWKDDDGCPDLDNDNDKFADPVDQCPTQPEDMDGFEDADGCPEVDNDGDGLRDLSDLCPNHAEDRDGVEDDDGCAEDDDKDGVLDGIDQCPDQPETYNLVKDLDGCPEPKGPKSHIGAVTDDQIELLDKIEFKTGTATLASKARTILQQVAAVLRNYSHITKVRIEGHTDSRGNKRANITLSQNQAKAVRGFLLRQRIAPDRLEAEGYGPGMPVASNKTKAGREANRRIDFMIVEKSPLGRDVSVPEAIIDLDFGFGGDDSSAVEEPLIELDLGGGDPDGESTSAPKPDGQAQPEEGEPIIELDLGELDQPSTDKRAAPKPESKSNPKPESKGKPDSESKPKSKEEAKPEPKKEAKSKPKKEEEIKIEFDF